MRQQDAFILNVVHFVDGQHYRHFVVAQLVEHHLVVRRPARAFDHEDHQLDVADRAAGRAVHQAVNGALLFHVQPGRVHVDGLVFAFGVNAHNAVTRGLRLTRGDRHLLPQQLVQ